MLNSHSFNTGLADTNLPPSAAAAKPPSRLAALLDVFFRHAGAIAVDHIHMMPLDHISGRTGMLKPPASRCYY